MQTNNIKDLQDLCNLSNSSVGVEAISTDKPKYSSSVEDLNNYELIYIIEGECTCEVSHLPKTTISKGDCILLKVGSKIKLSLLNNQTTIFYKIKAFGIQFSFFLQQIENLKNNIIFNIGQNVVIEGIIQNMIQIANENKKGAEILLDTSIFHILGIINYKTLNYNDREAPIVEKINTAKEILRNDVEAKISPEDIAHQLEISYSLFRREFRNFVGVSPSQYQMDIRLQRAQELLVTTNQSIAHIAEVLGFTDTAQFSTFFRKRQNITPREYRKKNR